jgi:hypothetical protein
MLAKLLKYELPAMGRKLLPLYAAWAVTAIILGICTQASASKSDLMAMLSILLYVGVTVAIMVLSVVMIIQRYSNSLLGDEAYFNHVLPVSVSAHIGNKVISATLWIFVTILVAILTGLLIALGAIIVGVDGVSLKELLQEANFTFPKHFGLMAIEVLILIIASSVKTIMQIYAAVTIGHQAQDHTTLASIGAYILVLIFESAVGRMIAPLLFNFKAGMENNVSFDMSLFLPALLVTAMFAAIYFFICKYLMEKRLNLA